MTVVSEPRKDHGLTRHRLSQSRVRDVDGYRGAVAGVDIEAIRVGRGTGSNAVMTVDDDDVTVTSCDIGFPILSRTTVGDDLVIISVIRSAPPGSRWCEIDLQRGQTLVHGPALEHRATNRQGLGFTFAVATAERLRARAEQLGASIQLPGRGEFHELRRPGADHGISEVLGAIAAPAAPASQTRTDGLLSAMVLALVSPSYRPRPRRDARRLDSRRIVDACVDLAAETRQVPSISELCAVTHVSERRLREAFTSVYDMPPSTFFHQMMLAEANRRLLLGVRASTTVSSVALDLGFGHLGRFARRYAQVYGELPSVTLRDRLPSFAP